VPRRRKSRIIRRLEEEYGKPIVKIVVDAVNGHATYDDAAGSLGVNVKTFWGWVARYGIRTRTVASAEEPVGSLD
jgi:hypothetical protein